MTEIERQIDQLARAYARGKLHDYMIDVATNSVLRAGESSDEFDRVFESLGIKPNAAHNPENDPF